MNLRIVFLIGVWLNLSSAAVGSAVDLPAPDWVLQDSLIRLLEGDSPMSLKNPESASLAFQSGYNDFSRYRETRSFESIERACRHFEKAFLLDPYNSNYRRALQSGYSILENRARENREFRQAVLLAERRFRLDPESFGYAGHYLLGDSYLQLDFPAFAESHLKRAREWLTQDLAAAPQENRKELHRAMAAIAVRLHAVYVAEGSPSQALDALEIALAYADPADHESLENRVGYLERWLFWGSKSALDLEIRVNRAIREGHYETARSGLDSLALLFPEPGEAWVEIIRRKAQFHFQYLQQPGKAMEMLMPRVLDDELSLPESGRQAMRDDYVSMCLIEGSRRLERDDRLAYTFFCQGAAVESPYRIRCLMELFRLSLSLPEEAAYWGERVWAERIQLTEEEANRVTLQMAEVYRRLGDVERSMKFYRVYKKGSSNGPVE
ncbi:MAG TPA: hypothetical protein ENN03_00015 [bacterium]|nr:hypothetical protein [bacterium]